MATIRMIRHGEAAGAYDRHPDPGLSATGRSQADAVAARLSGDGVSGIVSSPMARARETAAALAAVSGHEVAIDDAVSEIPSPGLTPAERGPWLRGVMAGTWADAGPEIRHWRDGIVEALLGFGDGTVVFSHFVAINAAIAVATSSDLLRCFHLDHCSVTTFEADLDAGALRLVSAGGEAATTVL